MKKTFLMFFLFLSFIGDGFAQNTQSAAVIDSLLNELEHVRSKLDKANIFYNIGLEYFNYDKDECQIYFSKTESLLKEISEKDEIFINFYFAKAFLLSSLNNYKTSDSLYDLAIYYSSKFRIDTLYHMINSLSSKAINLYYQGRYDESVSMFHDMEKRLKKLDTSNVKNKSLLISVYENKAIVLANMGRLSDALVFFEKSVLFRKEMYSPDDVLLIEKFIGSINNVALCYEMLNQAPKAIESYLEALVIAENHDMQEKTSLIYSNLSKLFLNQNNYDQCIKYGFLSLGNNPNYNFVSYNSMGLAYMNMDSLYLSNDFFSKALIISEKLDRPQKKCLININLGLNLTELGKLDSAILFLNHASVINVQLKDEFLYLKLNYAFGKYYVKKGMYRKALNYLLLAEKEVTQLGAFDRQSLIICDELYRVYKALNDYKQSLYWLEIKNIINTELDSLRNDKTVNDIEAKYQSQQKENKILKLENENIEKEVQLTQAKFATYGILGVLVLIIGLAYLLWFRQKQKQKLALLESAVAAGETEKNRIGRELHDGIAGSILKIVYQTENSHIELSNTLLETYNKVRNLSHQLNGTPIHGELFFDRLIDVMPEDKEGHVFNIKLLPNNMVLKEPYGTHVYRIVQELIANNLKHAKASKTNIEITMENDVLSVTYNDNGVGSSNFNKGNGYHNMENRVEIMNGSFDVSTKLGEGFKLVIKIPVIS